MRSSFFFRRLRVDHDRAVDGGGRVHSGDGTGGVPARRGSVGAGTRRVVTGDRPARLTRATIAEVHLDVRGRRVGERGRLTAVRTVAALRAVVDGDRVAGRVVDDESWW